MGAVPENVVLLHGFGGTHRAWDSVVAHLDPARYLPLALDLPGHGQQAAHEPADSVSFESCLESVLARSPEHFQLCGYSLGARIALHVALAAPERVGRLFLIGATPGIEDEGERERRREADHRLADALEGEDFEEWIERWRAQPLFAQEPRDVGELARADHRRNDPRALAAVLRGVGTGEMTPLWHRLAALSMPVCLLAGSRDQKFSDIARRMALLIGRVELAQLEGGHSLALERPAEVAAVLQGFRPQRAHPAGASAPAR